MCVAMLLTYHRLILSLLAGWLTVGFSFAAEPADDAATGPWVTSIATVGDGSQIAIASAQGLLLREGEVMLASTETPASPTVAYQQPAAVWAVSGSSDGKYLASTDYRGNLAIHDFQASETQHHDKAMERWTRALCFSPDSKHVVGGNEAGKLFVWNLEEKKVEKTHELDPQAVMDIQFSPAGDLLAVSDGGGHVHLLKWPSLEETAAITVCDQPVWSVVFAGNGLVAGAADNRIYYLEQSGGEAKEIAKLTDWVSDLAVGPTGLIAAAEIGGRVQIMTSEGQPVGAPADAPSGVWTLHWTNDGKLLVGTRKHGLQMMQQTWNWVEPPTAEEKPAEEKPAEEKPAEEKPAEEKPAEEKPAEEKPAEEKPAEEKPAEEKPAEEKQEAP